MQPSHKRNLVRVGALGSVVALTGGAWLAGRQVRSPAEAAATARPPVASRITAAVEQRRLESTVIVRGLVRYGDPRPVVLATSAVKASAGNAAAAQIVSAPAEKGATLPEGAVALTVDGRPVMVLQGRQPAYRDLRPGDTGEDVTQLESALARIGFDPGAQDGRYDDSTERAVDRWYESKGFRSFGPTESQRTQLRSARTTLAQADDGVLVAQRSVDQLRRSLTGDKLLSAQEQQRAAAEKAKSAQADAAVTVSRADGEVAARQEALDLAARQVALAEQALTRARRDAVDTVPVADANDAVDSARSALRQAQAAADDAASQVPLADATVKDAAASLDQARKDLDITRKTSATTIAPDGVIVVLDNTDRVRQAESVVRQAEATLRQAQANLTSAQRAVDTRALAVADAQRAVTRADAAVGRAQQSVTDRGATVADAEQRLLSAKNDLARAKRELDAAVLSSAATLDSTGAAVRQAKAATRIAAVQLGDVERLVDLPSALAQLRNAQATRTRAQNELTTLEQQIGIVVPANEVLFFPSLPLRVDEVKAVRGDVINGPVMTVTTSRLAVDSSVDTNDAKLVRLGAKVTIESSEFDVEIQGRVTEIAATAGTKGVDPGKVYLEVTPDADAVAGQDGKGSGVNPTELNGSSVKLTIPIQSTGKEVLAVPVAGVSVAADGSSRVEVEDAPDRSTRFVRVRTGIAAEGYVAVTPLAGKLAAGDLVVVGNRDGSAIEGALEQRDQPADAGSDTKVPDAGVPDSKVPETTMASS